MLMMCLEVLRGEFFCFSVRDWEEICRKILSLLFLNFQLPAKMLNFIFTEVTRKLGYLRWLNFVQENWLREHIMSPLKMTNLFQDMMPNFFPKNVGFDVSRSAILMISRTQLKPKNLQFLRPQISIVYQGNIVWTSPYLLGGSISYKMFKKKGGRFDMITIFRWGLLGKMGVKCFRWRVQFLHKSKLKRLLTKIYSSVNLNSEFSYF